MATKRPKVAILIPDGILKKTISEEEKQRLLEFADIQHEPFNEAKEDVVKRIISGADGCITGWGSCRITEEILKCAPDLKIITHAGGTVKGIVSDGVWTRGIVVTSAAASIAIGVAETTLGLLISTLKRFYWFNDVTHNGKWNDDSISSKVKELYGISIGVVGGGYVGRHFIKLLQSFDVKICLYDPFVSYEEAKKLNVKKIEKLEDLMKEVDVVSLHAPSLPETLHMINANNLKLMKDGAILINTARGALIDEKALIEELKKGRITACIDVTDPEPPSVDNELRKLSNVVLTPHIAGAVANNIFRQGKFAITEIERFFSGLSLIHQVTKESLSIKA